MFHTQQMTVPMGRVKAGCVVAGAAAMAVGGLSACEGTTVLLPPPHFGQDGQIQVEVSSLLPGEAKNGQLDEILIWASNGPWLLTERVSYEGNLGAETMTSSRLNPGELAQEYASLVQQLNETQGLRLFDGEVSQGLEPECGAALPPTRVVFTIRDDVREEVATWNRCAAGTLFTFEPGGAGPDAGATRVITAGQLTRFFTLGESSISTYSGTIPFAVLDQGPDSPARAAVSRAFASSTSAAPGDFVQFWGNHAGPTEPLPEVDWESEVVLLIAVGVRREAGDVVRLRRVLPLGPANGTRVEIVERVPGDFCSPAAVNLYPFQLLVVPGEDVHPPIEFTEPQVERISCDGT